MNDDEKSEVLRRWLNGLEERERNTAELLDSYFALRSPLPGDIGGVKLVPEYRTTEDIRDDLYEMMDVPPVFLFTYMLKAGYGFATRPDGSVTWAVWRLPATD